MQWTIEFYDQQAYEILIPQGNLKTISSRPILTQERVDVWNTPIISGIYCPAKSYFEPITIIYDEDPNNDGRFFAEEWFKDFSKNTFSIGAFLKLWESQNVIEMWDLTNVIVISIKFENELEFKINYEEAEKVV